MAFKFSTFSPKQKYLMAWWTMPHHDDTFIVLAEGSIRSGKTIAEICGFLLWAEGTFSGEMFIVAGKTIGALRRNVIRPMMRILDAWGVEYAYTYSNNVLTIKGSGNEYHCFGANNEASQDIVQGMTAAGALLDEVALMPESFVQQAMGRCSIEGSRIWCNCNPENPYHYVKTDIIDMAVEKGVLVMHFNMSDNLTLSQKVIERYKKQFSGVWKQRYIDGLWVAAEGAVYSNFGEQNIATELPDMPYRVMVGVDYGTSNPCVFLKFYLYPDGYIYLVDEYYWDSKKEQRQKSDTEYADDLYDFCGNDFYDGLLDAIYIDPSAASFILESKNRRWDKKHTHHDGTESIVQRVPPITPAKNDVIDGIRFVSNYIGAGDLKVLVNKCPCYTKEVYVYSWKPDKKSKGKDEVEKVNDHAQDACRYALYTHFNGNGLLSFMRKKAAEMKEKKELQNERN